MPFAPLVSQEIGIAIDLGPLNIRKTLALRFASANNRPHHRATQCRVVTLPARRKMPGAGRCGLARTGETLSYSAKIWLKLADVAIQFPARRSTAAALSGGKIRSKSRKLSPCTVNLFQNNDKQPRTHGLRLSPNWAKPFRYKEKLR